MIVRLSIMKNYYKTLRIPLLSPAEDVKEAYRKLAMQYHPDKNHGVEFFNLYFAEIKEAYDFLMNHEDKEKYDNIIRANPELLDVTTLTIANKEELQLKKTTQNIHLKLNSSYKTMSLVIFILFVLAIIFYRGKVLNHFFTPEIKNVNDTTLGATIDKGLVNNTSQRYQDSLIKDKEIQEKKLKPLAVTNVQEKEIVKPKLRSVNYCEKITAEVNGDELNLINKNKFVVFRVEVEITRLYNRNNTYDPSNHYGSVSNMPRFETEYKTFFNVQPGVTWIMSGDRDLSYAKVLSCELN